MIGKWIGAALATVTLGWMTPAAAQAQGTALEARFDQTLGTQARAPRTFEAVYQTALEQRIAALANGSQGRIGVMAIDLSNGQEVGILADQRFPMASTSKIAVAATFLEGVEQGRWSLTSEFPLLIPRASARFSTPVAPVTQGKYYPAIDLIEMMITRSSNPATDALLAVVGGPQAVNAWARRNGIAEFSIDRDIATLVRDDGEFNPANHIDLRDSATPRAMAELLRGLYQGKYLSRQSSDLLLASMSRTITGKRRIRGMMPLNAEVLNKTGSLNNTSSDVGIIKTEDGRAIAVAIYVTGQGTRPAREAKIAAIARALYDGYRSPDNARQMAQATYDQAGSGGN
ncbi:serine hydrolase [Porphyrobacter sp. GA68]|uniref:serine hydrolase n=1 Tax=Porphyrobacter sp. GA68 TaxID=2883480 RepID=UPI001D17E8EE|nr:serine hydrolase [Porphyrobacter sp. GA68]